MNKKAILFFLLTLSVITNVYAQEQDTPRCPEWGNASYYISDPIVFQNRLEVADVGQIVVIPVVVHVVYNNQSQNISDERILSQIAALNRDYRRDNADTLKIPNVFKPLSADMKIEFCLARIDPNGLPTTGITRTPTTKTSFSPTNEDVKKDATGGKSGWNPENYLNIWVCNLTGTTLGYYPSLSPSPVNTFTDGVVVRYDVFGTIGLTTKKYNKGRTLVHEVGHWLQLLHPWGVMGSCEDTDYVDDTPVQPGSTLGCAIFPYVDQECSNGPSGRMFSNFMDYSNDSCMNIFTKGQVKRARSELFAKRSSILTSQKCDSQSPSDVVVSIRSSDSLSFCTSSTNLPLVEIFNFTLKSIRKLSLQYTLDGVILDTIHWSGILNSYGSISFNFPLPTPDFGNHTLSAKIISGLDTSNTITDNDFVEKNITYYRCINTSIEIFPNPAQTMLFFNAYPAVKTIIVYNAWGAKILQVTDPIEVDVSSLPSGVYVLVAQSQTSQRRITLAIQR